MKKDNEKRLMIIFGVLGEILIIWLSLLIAPTIGGGLPQMLPKLADAFEHSFSFSWSEKTIPCILLLSMIYGFSLLVWHYTKPNYRRREEHGSAKWGDVKAVDKKYRQEPMENNRILTQNLSIGYNSREHRRNLNTLIVGGSGSGKTFHYGCRKLGIRRTLTTESLAVFMPFRVQEICHSKGIYLGNNAISKNPIIVNRSELLNGNSFILGVSGSGKSMLAKQELVNIYLSDPNADIFVIDPEREMTEIVNTLGGENIKLSAASENHINALDMSRDYGDGENPLILKSEFMLSLCRDIVGNLGAKEKSIIDRCTSIVYRDYLLHGCVGEAPTMKNFYDALLAQDELEAKELALALELYINGNLNIFAKPTNVNMQSRLVCYDIHGLGEELMSPSMRIVLDSIYNRVTSNKAKGRKTYIFIDEIYILFAHEHSAQFLHKLWRRVRKAGGYVIGVTQNVEDLLDSPTAKFMLANSEYVIMLNQAATDRMRLAEVMKISESQMAYFTNTEAGHGLAKIGGAFVPFVNRLPKDTELYRMMTTKFGE